MRARVKFLRRMPLKPLVLRERLSSLLFELWINSYLLNGVGDSSAVPAT